MTPLDQRAAHWEQVYQSKADCEMSWFQDEPNLSLELVRAHAPRGGRIIDVGGGSSVLAARLAAEGFDVTVLDISEAAIERARQRSGEAVGQIRWVVADVTQAGEIGAFDVWHDRAAFHFLTDVVDRQRYIALAKRSIVPGGHAVIGTFAMAGPDQCSGLPVERYDEAKIARAFGAHFAIVAARDHLHATPWGRPQAFLCAVMRCVGEA